MKFLTGFAAVFLLMPLIAGCGGEDGGGKSARTPEETAVALDEGPRAVEVLTLDMDRAELGSILFDAKSCSDCHSFGEADMAPDLAGVLERRALPWLKKQITDPAWMNEHDPITKALIEEYDLEMVGLGVSDSEAEDLLHYILRESGTAAE